MIRVSSRTRHHTREQIVGMVDETLSIAAELELEGEDRQTLLPGILNLVSATHLELEQATLAMQAARLHGERRRR